MYNAITRSAEKELFPVLRRFGLDYVAYNPIAGGILSGKYKTSDVPKEGRYSDSVGQMGGMYRKRYFKDSTFEALRIIEPAVEKAGLTMVETALRWMVHHSQLKLANKGGNDGKSLRRSANHMLLLVSLTGNAFYISSLGIIIGVSSYDQLDKNLTDLEKGPLPEDVVKALDEAWSVIGGSAPDYWHLPYEYKYDTIKAVYGDDA
jgi:aflatoxin B1 aldehyde reductase